MDIKLFVTANKLLLHNKSALKETDITLINQLLNQFTSNYKIDIPDWEKISTSDIKIKIIYMNNPKIPNNFRPKSWLDAKQS